jgi:hypothetical protein
MSLVGFTAGESQEGTPFVPVAHPNRSHGCYYFLFQIAPCGAEALGRPNPWPNGSWRRRSRCRGPARLYPGLAFGTNGPYSFSRKRVNIDTALANMLLSLEEPV